MCVVSQGDGDRPTYTDASTADRRDRPGHLLACDPGDAGGGGVDRGAGVCQASRLAETRRQALVLPPRLLVHARNLCRVLIEGPAERRDETLSAIVSGTGAGSGNDL